MARHLIRGNLHHYLQRGLMYCRRWIRKFSWAFRRRRGLQTQPWQRPVHRRRRLPIRFSRRLLSQVALGVILVLVGTIVAIYPLETGGIVTKMAGTVWRTSSFSINWFTRQLYPSLVFSFQADQEIPDRIFEAGLPQVSSGEKKGLDLLAMAKQLVTTVTSVNLDQVESILEAQFLGSEFELPEYMTERAPDPALLPIETKPELEIVKDKARGDQPLVAIYHTHSSESFHGRSEHLAGEQFFTGDYCWGETKGVIAVGDELARVLADEYRIPVVHSRQIHDYPVFRNAYTNSKLTLEKILREYPSIKVVLDIHRDGLSQPPEEAIKAVVAGEGLARVAIVVGKGREGYANPHWDGNNRFAERLHQKLEELYPGLSRGIVVKDWPYNQELHEQALLIEVGDHYNTREEAVKSARLVADALADLLNE